MAKNPILGKISMAKVKVPKIIAHQGKGSRSQMLPSRHALNTLTGGDPAQRSMQNYGKLTPSGAGAPGSYSDIESMGESGIGLDK